MSGFASAINYAQLHTAIEVEKAVFVKWRCHSLAASAWTSAWLTRCWVLNICTVCHCRSDVNGREIFMPVLGWIRAYTVAANTSITSDTTTCNSSVHSATVTPTQSLVLRPLLYTEGASQNTQEAQLSPRDRAMRRVSWNLANCHATVQKLLVRQVLNQISAVANWPVRQNRAVDSAWRSVR